MGIRAGQQLLWLLFWAVLPQTTSFLSKVVIPGVHSSSTFSVPPSTVLYASAAPSNQTAAESKKSHPERWNYWIEQLDEYYKEFGTYDVPVSHDDKKKNNKWHSLATWVQYVRLRQAKLTKQQKEDLDARNITINGSLEERNQRKWEEMLACLVEYNNTHGDMKVPFNSKLGRWLSQQKHYWKRNTLKPEREAKLRSIGYEFQVREFHHTGMRTKHDEKWEQGLANLTKFYDENGHYWPSGTSSNATLRTLQYWCGYQRKRKKKGQLDAERIAKLDRIGFPWDDQERRDSSWFQYFQQYKEVLEEWRTGGMQGNLNGPKTLGVKLYTWVVFQHVLYGKGTLDPKRKEFLDSIGFEWKNFTAGE